MKTDEKSIRLFKSDLLEKTTHVHPIVPLFLWVPVIGYFLWKSYENPSLSAWSIGIIGAAGIFSWTLVEYLIHRFPFHFDAKGPIGKRLVFLFHGIHHETPMDKTRLVMPPVPGIAIAYLLYSFFQFLLGPVWVDPFFAFFLVGYLIYDYTHYAVHHFKPKTAFGRMVKHHHMIHHFEDSESRFGVSSPLWDYVFGTLHSRGSIGSKAEDKGQMA